jgi:hypothetical protein
METCFSYLGETHGRTQGGDVGLKQDAVLGAFPYFISKQSEN